MKKIIIIILIGMNFITLDANNSAPTYKIIANSNTEEDIQEMYELKDELLNKYKDWVKGVDDEYQALADHTYAYDATFYNGEYAIVIGDGKGKKLTGKLQSSYCTSGKEIEKKSFFGDLFS